MGCFVTCFCSSKHRSRRSFGAIIPSQHHTQEAAPLAESAKIDEIGKPLSPISNLIPIVDEYQKPNCCGKKKVKFDLTEKLPTNNVAEKIRNESEKKEESPNESYLVASTKLPYPLTRVAGEIDFDCDSIKKNDERQDVGDSAHWQASFVHEESSESLFSLSIDSRKQVYGEDAGDKEVNSPMPVAVCDSPEKKLGSKPLGGLSNHVESVLTPLENLTQLKSTKTRIPSSKHADKENVGLEQNCGTMAASTNFEKKSAAQDFGVDTSLSNWLVSSKTSSHESKSASETIASGESDEMILGTVGSYWSHTGQSLDSDSRSCYKITSEESEAVANEEKLKWKADPFDAKLVAQA